MPKKPRNLSTKQFAIGPDKPIQVRFLRPDKSATQIRIGGKLLRADSIELPSAPEGDLLRRLDFKLTTRRGLELEKQDLKVEILAGEELFQDTVSADDEEQTVCYRFMGESSGKLVYCPVRDDLVVTDANGKCSNCHVDHFI